MTEANLTSRELPLAVWACAQQPSQQQRRNRYLSASTAHPGKLLPELARRAITAYSGPGDLVVDPMCGIGTTLVEAIHLDRRAIGVELEQRWAALAIANLAHAHDQGASGRAGVIEGDARQLPRLLSRHARRFLNDGDGTARLPAGSVDLILTSPPYGNATLGDPSGGHGIVRARAAKGKTPSAADRARARRAVRVCRYGTTQGNIGELPYRGAGGNDYLGAMGAVYAACATVLRPGGFLAIVTKELRAKGELRNLAGDTVTLARHAGLQYWQHVSRPQW